MKVGLSLSAAVTMLVVGISMTSCQTYDFEPVEPLAIAQTTEKTAVYSRKAKPNIMLVVDKSGSMLEATSNGTRLSEMKQAMATFLTQYGTTARLGLAVFPDATASDPCHKGKLLRTIVQSNDVDAELQAAAGTINDTIQSIGSPQLPATGGTPTAPTLADIANVPELQDPNRDNFVLLLTDGLPNCNSSLDTATCTCVVANQSPCQDARNCLDHDQVVRVVEALRAKNIKTIVVGFGADTGASLALPVLNAMAEKGGFARSCTQDSDCGGSDTCETLSNNEKLCSTRFYQAASATELAEALAKIGNIVGNSDPCVFQLGATPTDPSFLAVYINGEKTPPGDQTWNYSTPNTQPTVTFTGDLCTRILNATEQTAVDVEIRIVEAL